MRLSEAIRLGSMLKPQAIGAMDIASESTRVVGDVLGLRSFHGTCAFGAALDAHPCELKPKVVGANSVTLRGGVTAAIGTTIPMVELPDEWHRVLWVYAPCPQCGERDVLAFKLIAHLNDDHRWSRQRIADWVERIERSQEATTQIAEPVREVSQ